MAAMSVFTVDDTADSLIYSPGWGISSPSDPLLPQYFQSTYHASQSLGATVNLTFSGNSISLYGSKGPTHGLYSVRCDDSVQFLSAISKQQQYRQILFSSPLPSGTHSLTLTNTDGLWLDLDYVTVTTDGNFTSITPSFSSTITRPGVSTASTSDTSLPSAGSFSPASASSTSNTNDIMHTITLALAIGFGILFLCTLAISAWFWLNRNRGRTRPAREPSSVTVNNHPESPFVKFQEVTHPRPSLLDQDQRSAPSTQWLLSSGSASPDIFSGPGVQPSTSSPFRSSTAPRPWSPFSGHLKHVFKNGKSDGTDSMKSTFLQV